MKVTGHGNLPSLGETKLIDLSQVLEIPTSVLSPECRYRLHLFSYGDWK